MATTEQQTRSSSRQSTDEAESGRVPSWPTRDLERRGDRGTEDLEAQSPEATTPEATGPETLSPETTMKTAPEPAVKPAPATSRASSFLADLTRAMRSTAEDERGEVLARFGQDADAFVESMRGEFAGAADASRARCETDVSSIEAWCESELERIRRETERGIAQRRERLEAELAAQTARLDEGVARVAATVTSFEGDMASFFERLLAEEDPSTFAVMARQLPEPPAFAPWPPVATPESEAWVAPAGATLDLEALAAAEAEAAAALEAEGYPTPAPVATPPATASTAPPAAAAPGASPDATRVVVAALGLVSVASVSSFKRALAHAEGVRGVQVSSGPQGEFLFTMTCDPGVDLGALVSTLPGFDVEVRGSSPDSVQVVARDLESEG
jgi:hypothetical protein